MSLPIASRISCWLSILLVVPNLYIDTVTLELRGKATDICLSVVIREQHLGLDNLRCPNQLLRSHRVGLVAGQKSYVNVPDGFHFRNVLRVPGNIDSQAVDGQDIAVVAPFGMELRMSFLPV